MYIRKEQPEHLWLSNICLLYFNGCTLFVLIPLQRKGFSSLPPKVDARRRCCCRWRDVENAPDASLCQTFRKLRSWMTEVVQAFRRNGTRVWLLRALLRCSTCGFLWLLFLGVHSTNGWYAQHAPAGCPHAPQQTLRHSQHEALGLF